MPISHVSRRIPLAAALLLALTVAAASPAQALKVVSYNLLNYDNQAAARNSSFQTVLGGIGAIDILAVQEIQDQTAVNNFYNLVLQVIEPGLWAQAPFTNDPNANFNQGFFYRTSAVTVVQADTLGNEPRDIAWCKFRIAGYSGTGAEFIVFSTHFKASSGSTNEATRALEAERIRNFMNSQPAGTQMMVVGDFNMRSSTETAYQTMIQSQGNNIGRVQDPINSPGTWYNNGAFSAIHTQSTRTVLLNPNDGGATGGMDDRFDFILPTLNLEDGEGMDQLPSTYDAYGQDGSHFNANINDAPTIPEGAAVANALQRASDHLPVVLEFQVPAQVSADASLDFGTLIEGTGGAAAEQTLTVGNVAAAPADELDYTLIAPVGFTVPGGPFQVAAGADGMHTVTILTNAEGNLAGNLVVSSDDGDDPNLNVALSGTVWRASVPSFREFTSDVVDTIDYGTRGDGDFPDTTWSVFNLDYDALQSPLEVYDATPGGSDRFSLVGFSPTVIEGGSGVFTIAFDDSAATPDSTYEGFVTFSTRDEPGPAGAADRTSLTLYFSATVTGTQVGVGDGPGPDAGLRANHPNPFRGSTRIGFVLSRGSNVNLDIFDIQGRRVRGLLDDYRGEGAYDLVWDGRDDVGRQVSPGIYFYRLRTDGEVESRRMTKLR